VYFTTAWPLDFPFLLDLACAEPFFAMIFSTIAKMRFVLAFDTPRCAASSAADFTGNEIETAFGMNNPYFNSTVNG
jgi:hypothetical protein